MIKRLFPGGTGSSVLVSFSQVRALKFGIHPKVSAIDTADDIDEANTSTVSAVIIIVNNFLLV